MPIVDGWSVSDEDAELMAQDDLMLGVYVLEVVNREERTARRVDPMRCTFDGWRVTSVWPTYQEAYEEMCWQLDWARLIVSGPRKGAAIFKVDELPEVCHPIRMR